jgi:hypothetical protein
VFDGEFLEKTKTLLQFCLTTKVVMHKSLGEVSLLKQETVENVSVANLKFII